MKLNSVKFKILITIISLSLVSLITFSLINYNLYTKDKLSYLYSSMANDTQGKSEAFKRTIDKYETILDSSILVTDLKKMSIPFSFYSLLKTKRNIQSIELFKKSDNKTYTLYSNSSAIDSKNLIAKASNGLSILNPDKGTFIIKKSFTSNKGSYIYTVFEDFNLLAMISGTPDEFSMLLGIDSLTKNSFSRFIKSSDVDIINKHISKLPVSAGVFKTSLSGKIFFIAYSKLNSKNQIYVTAIQKDKFFSVQKSFMNQSVLFLFLVSSIALMIGTLGARWMTWHLDCLTKAAKNYENENFDEKIEFDSGDEFEILGNTFNSMGSKIVNLLSELRRHNEELEIRVKERTEDLKRLSDIQKGMLNSLGQGFVLIDKNLKVSDIHSKVAQEMFDGNPSELSPWEILPVKEEEKGNFQELYSMVFGGLIDFEDMIGLSPDKTTNSKESKIALNYAPILNNDSKELDYILVIATDKTLELESIEKFDKQWKYSQMISRIAQNKFTINKVIRESLSMLDKALTCLKANEEYSAKKIQGLVHTIKGGVAYFHIDSVKDYAHDLEDFLQPFYDQKVLTPEQSLKVRSDLKELKNLIFAFTTEFNSIIEYSEKDDLKQVESKDLKDFYNLLKTKDSMLANNFHKSFFKVKIAPYFESYNSIVSDLGIKLNKDARLEMNGLDLSLPDEQWETIFSQMIHLVRNSMDHGIELPSDREINGKDKTATIKLNFELEESQLVINYSDDGQGIDWKKVQSINPKAIDEKTAIEMILNGGLSTKSDVTDTSGRGIGLSSLYKEILNWGGEMRVQNQLSKGICFKIILPLKPNANLRIAS